jgi:hypothetical protein
MRVPRSTRESPRAGVGPWPKMCQIQPGFGPKNGRTDACCVGTRCALWTAHERQNISGAAVGPFFFGGGIGAGLRCHERRDGRHQWSRERRGGSRVTELERGAEQRRHGRCEWYGLWGRLGQSAHHHQPARAGLPNPGTHERGPVRGSTVLFLRRRNGPERLSGANDFCVLRGRGLAGLVFGNELQSPTDPGLPADASDPKHRLLRRQRRGIDVHLSRARLPELCLVPDGHVARRAVPGSGRSRWRAQRGWSRRRCRTTVTFRSKPSCRPARPGTRGEYCRVPF